MEIHVASPFYSRNRIKTPFLTAASDSLPILPRLTDPKTSLKR